MRVERVEIKDFKGAPDVNLEIGGANVYFVGKNGGGKTSLIDAIFGNLKKIKHPLKV